MIPGGNTNIVWVPVSGGKATGSGWSGDGATRGYALYDATVWSGLADSYKEGKASLIDPDVPGPLLFLPAGGYRNCINANVNYTGSHGYYWSSDGSTSDESSITNFFSGYVCTWSLSRYKANGLSVRCIAE
jgi:hypothetical protein